ncbi:TetR/AcrR family transcriptional regulator C-terminal domain-containing protein [Nocardioides humi]|uniref:TetR/AcrR family transcriptional regulator n=1 Tax=Nocardioides humi TaxID=449461 RepID=A0ABN2ATA6_9ACTN|nr:TetR/AcrR family transcriptional regulator C-terminal domain-containing protein [Nocardioides humi]
MTSASTGSGEPSRTLALLWGEPAGARRKGPARSVTVAQVVDAALALADAEGLAAVTMRAVAERVGVSAMSVYTYVPGKPELLDLMVDARYARMPREPWGRQAWRQRLTTVAEANRDLLAAHPWLTEVAALSRPPLGPGVMAKYEHELAALDDTGLSEVDTDAALAYLLGFVQSHGRSAHDAARVGTDSAMSDAEWWAANQPVLARALDPAAYPRAVRIGAAAGAAQGSAWSAERAWEFGLARTLDGLAALIGDGVG